MPLMGLALAVAGAALPALAQPADHPVGCVFRESDRAQLRALMESMDDSGPDMVEARRRARICADRYGWSHEQLLLSSRYAAGLVHYDTAVAALRPYGIDPALLTDIHGRLDGPTRAALLAGVSDPLVPIVLERLQAIGFQPEGRSVPELERLGAIIAQGVVGLLIRDDAFARFEALAARRINR